MLFSNTNAVPSVGSVQAVYEILGYELGYYTLKMNRTSYTFIIKMVYFLSFARVRFPPNRKEGLERE